MRFPSFRSRFAPVIRPLAPGFSSDCALLHGKFFARPWSGLEIEDLLRRPDNVAHAALDGPEKSLLGFAISRCVLPEAELLSIAVRPDRQRSGLGRELLGSHLAGLAAAGASQVFLEVDQDNQPALALYRRFGFQQVGERKGYYVKRDGSRATALVLRAELS